MYSVKGNYFFPELIILTYTPLRSVFLCTHFTINSDKMFTNRHHQHIIVTTQEAKNNPPIANNTV